MRLRAHLFRLVTIALLPALALTVILTWVLVQKEQDDQRAALLDLARAVSLGVETEVLRSVTALQVLVLSAHLKNDDLAAFRAQAQAAVDIQGTWSNIIVLRADGTHLMNLRTPPGGALPKLTSIDVVLRAAQERKPQISGVILGSIIQRPVVYLAVPVLRGTDVPYVLTAVIDYDTWTARLKRQLPPATRDRPPGQTPGGDQRHIGIREWR